MMHPDSLWAGSQLAMAVQAIGVKNRTTCDFLFAYVLHAGTSNKNNNK